MPSTPDALAWVRSDLRCPACFAAMTTGAAELVCDNPTCGCRYPVHNGVPHLIPRSSDSLFKGDVATSKPQQEFFDTGGLKRTLKRLIAQPGVRLNDAAFQRLAAELARVKDAKVLIVGGGEAGAGIQPILANPAFKVLETDVVYGLRTKVIMDAHMIPVADGTFDGCILQAVLEHVCDPHKVMAEVSRVLKPNGLVYAETPFMQQVHMGRFDFTRFTHLGHRRLFRAYTTIEDGAVAGTGTALAWSIERFLMSFTRHPTARLGLKLLSRLLFSHVRFFDYLTRNAPETMDSASGFYFLGRKTGVPITDNELIKLYRGAERRF